MLLILMSLQTAEAARPSLEPVVRVHGGASMVQGPSPWGLNLGVDSRLTRSVFLDVSGFATPISVADASPVGEVAELSDWFALRHGLTTTVGLRIPHPQPKSFRWDVFLRGGMGVMATDDLNPKNTQDYLQIDVAGVVGADAQIMFGKVGLRVGGKVAMLSPYFTATQNDVFFWSPQYAAELVYEL